MRTTRVWKIAGVCVAFWACSKSDRSDSRDPDASGGEAGAVDATSGDQAGTGQASAGDTGVEGEATCASFVRLLTDCGLLSGSRLAGCDDENPLLACAADCVRATTCDAMEAMYCSGAYNDFAVCLDECQARLPLPEFLCDDGERIPARWRCDGAADCENEEDEACPEGAFVCPSGLSIPAGWQCDGVSDCPSGEDELGCSAALTCGDGSSVPAVRECDGTADCEDGADELDCARLTCP